MKKYPILFWLALLCAPVLAQNSAFVLVDVSGNPVVDKHKITPAMRQEAIDLARAIITNSYNSSFDSKWELDRGKTHSEILNIVNQQGRPLIGSGGLLMIMPFGARHTYKQFQINPIQNYPADFNRHWKFPFQYDQQRTFGAIARARAANVAVDAGVGTYYLVVIEGKGEDTDSWTYTQTEIDYMDDYRSASNINSLAVFRYRNKNVDFKVEISRIDVSRLVSNSPGTQQPIITPGNVSQKTLQIVTPKGDRASPDEFSEDDKITVSWRCLGCSDSTRYLIQIRNTDRSGKRIAPITVYKQFTHRLPPLDAGTYEIKVSGENLSSQRVYIDVGSGGGLGWLIVLLVLAGLAALGWYIWKNFFNNTDDDDEHQPRSLFDESDRQKTQPAPSSTPQNFQSGGGDSQSSDYF